MKGGHEMYCYYLEIMDLNPSRIKLGMHSTSVQVTLEPNTDLITAYLKEKVQKRRDTVTQRTVLPTLQVCSTIALL